MIRKWGRAGSHQLREIRRGDLGNGNSTKMVILEPEKFFTLNSLILMPIVWKYNIRLNESEREKEREREGGGVGKGERERNITLQTF